MIMKNAQEDRPIIRFSTPDPMTNSILVSRVLPDYSTEPIGEINPEMSKEGDSLIYSSTNNQGEELIPPTADFIKIEERFESYAKELSVKDYTAAMLSEADKIEDRKASVKNIRSWKIRNKETLQINQK
jgi:hypothetical protein